MHNVIMLTSGVALALLVWAIVSKNWAKMKVGNMMSFNWGLWEACGDGKIQGVDLSKCDKIDKLNMPQFPKKDIKTSSGFAVAAAIFLALVILFTLAYPKRYLLLPCSLAALICIIVVMGIWANKVLPLKVTVPELGSAKTQMGTDYILVIVSAIFILLAAVLSVFKKDDIKLPVLGFRFY